MKIVLSVFLGILLVVAGTAVLTYQGVTVTTAQRQLLRVGPLQAATEQSNWTITLPPILGAALLAGGTLLIFGLAMMKHAPKHEDHTDNHVVAHNLTAPKTT
jgi:ABC-type Fe3+-siderophore transport system permease subunit